MTSDSLRKIIQFCKDEKLPVAIKFDDLDCITPYRDRWFFPTQTYIESGMDGPRKIEQVQSICIKNYSILRIGRLVPDKAIDKTDIIAIKLEECKIQYELGDDFILISFC